MILNGRSYGEETESYIFKPRSFAIPQYEMKGTLEGWKQEVGVYCEGNSRLMLYVIAALSAPFLKITHRQGFGVHLYGTSSVGKTTTLEVASSVFGSKIHTWRTTDNAAETLVLQSNDAPFLIDELGQADAGSAYNMAYMLSNGETKNRANKLGKNGNTAVSFRTVFLSGGEIPFETKFKERQKEKTAGQSVRCIELRADAGCDKGAFNTVHEFGTPDQFVLHLKEAVHRHYGVASEALLHHLTTADHEEIEMKIREDIRFWKERHLEALLKVTETSDGQILRVGENFAFLASIGEYCIDLGILPWNAGSAFEMMGSLFESWIEDRGGTLPHELLQVEKRLRLLIYQESDRFEAEDEDMTFTSRPISKRAGIRLKKKSEEKTYYCIFTDVMDDEVLKGADKKMALSFLIKKEILISPLKDRYTTQVRMKSFGLNSHAGSYKINPNML
ncbi:DUF927 domain-containing protein [Candidatus Bealeia paramacronuclearis]|uniref:DUF927 domain-containing protein n=1 Tax=Candidatus Bealeia paramacronuclearis TaxID=1921001 RepID=UPI0030D28E85